MIVVIADDLSGAAELAGIAFCHGLSAEVHTDFDPTSSADLIAIDTNTRSCSEQESARRVAEVVHEVRRMRPDWLFKKVDSVLRGPVLAELTSLLGATGRRRVLLVPANPSHGRAIRGGQYFVDGRPLHETEFGADPEHPARSSDILRLLGAEERPDVCVIRPEQDLPQQGIVVGEAATPADLAAWARRTDEDTLPAGAADFFAAMLAAKGFRPNELTPAQQDTTSPEPTLFVCGSPTAWTRMHDEDCRKHAVPVVVMPPALAQTEQSPDLIGQWADAAVAALDRRGVAMVAIGRQLFPDPSMPHLLLGHLVELITRVLQTRNVPRLFVEGGGTASALYRHLGWSRASVCGQYAPGIVAMQVNSEPPARVPPARVTVKPGSYSWPEGVWQELNLS